MHGYGAMHRKLHRVLGRRPLSGNRAPNTAHRGDKHRAKGVKRSSGGQPPPVNLEAMNGDTNGDTRHKTRVKRKKERRAARVPDVTASHGNQLKKGSGVPRAAMST